METFLPFKQQQHRTRLGEGWNKQNPTLFFGVVTTFIWKKLLWDGTSQVCSWFLEISGGQSLIDLAIQVRKKALYCGLWSSNAHYWKASNSLKIVVSGAGIFAVFGTIGFPFRRIGSVSEAGHNSVLVFPDWDHNLVRIHCMSIKCLHIHVLVLLTSLQVGDLVSLRIHLWKKLRHVMNSFPELGWWKTNCVSLKLKVFKKAVNNIQKDKYACEEHYQFV